MTIAYFHSVFFSGTFIQEINHKQSSIYITQKKSNNFQKMPKQTFKIPTVKKKGEAAKGAKGKKVAQPKSKKKKTVAQPPAATTSAAASSSAAEPSTTGICAGPSTSGLDAGPSTSLEASPNTSSTSIETSSSAASQELTVTAIAGKNDSNSVEDAEKDESGSDKSEALTETASEKSETNSNAPCSSKTIPKSPQPLSLLKNKWTLWYYMPKKGIPWEECQERVYSFNTVERFWSMFNHLKKPSELPAVADLALFKKDYRPMWEDAINKNGGRWLIMLNRHRQKDVEDVWREALMFLIGENYQYTDSVCGVVISHRTYCDKIAIWTSNKVEHEVMSIGKCAKRYMLLDFSPQMAFESHAETQFNANTIGKASSKTMYKI